jgi:nucleoside-diphosphate-sugar epimerase
VGTTGDDSGRLAPHRGSPRLTGLSEPTLWRLRRRGDLPEPVRLSPGRCAWPEDTIRERDAAVRACAGATEVYQLAADMGGMGFIENNKALCMLSVLINTHMLMAARDAGVRRFFYASSACVYNADKQRSPDVVPLREEDAYPALPEDGYGWEKLFSERMCRHFREDFGLETRTARYHNVYGPHGTWDGGREKAPAAICRKVIAAKHSGHHEIEIWGTAPRPARSCTSTIASPARRRSCPATPCSNPSTSDRASW